MTAVASRSQSKREWVRAVESASLDRGHPQETEAAERFDALRSPARKMALVREIVVTRRGEITLAYRNVIMVTAGYKSRLSANGVCEVHPEPCVIFVVKHKWSDDAEGPARQRLPRRVLTFGNEGQERYLYAVPTDVQPASWFSEGVARAASCVLVDQPSPEFRLPGALTCGVGLSGAVSATSFALSAMHVLSPVPMRSKPAGRSGLTAIGGGDAVRGSSAVWGGQIDPVSQKGFDVQLAEISDTAWFGRAFEGEALSATRPYVAAHDIFDDLAARMRFRILAPRNHPRHLGAARDPMLAQFTSMVHDEFALAYQVRFNGAFQTVPIRHDELIVMRVLDDCPAPESGDSGSAVISWWPDGSSVFVGMFIASGNGAERERIAYVNPAWQLFDPANWTRLPAGTLALTPTFSLP